MYRAQVQNRFLGGWQAARAELFKYVTDATIPVGHSLKYDLDPLHIQHDKIADSVILTSDAVYGNKCKAMLLGSGSQDFM